MVARTPFAHELRGRGFGRGAASSLGIAAALLLPHSAVASADEPPAADPPPSHWTFAAGVETDFPIDVAGRLELETLFRLRVSTSLGVLPGPYVSAMNGFLEGVGAYDSATGTLITSTLQSSLVWRTHVGVRPFPKLGLYGDLGYGLVTLGGSTTTSEVLAAVTGATFPAADATSSKMLSVKSTLQMLDVEIGWVVPIVDHVQLRGALGGAFTVAASTTVTPDFTPRAPAAVNQFADASATYLDHEFKSYVFTPVFTVGAAYVF